ncbi:MAG: hypothetical protein MZU97_21340 [Bacillus subtilis]|nr:hypothetical protein [Bacillus subtilis]
METNYQLTLFGESHGADDRHRHRRSSQAGISLDLDLIRFELAEAPAEIHALDAARRNRRIHDRLRRSRTASTTGAALTILGPQHQHPLRGL